MKEKYPVVEKNVSGRYYVDESCIYCEYCVENASGNFTHDPKNRFAYISKQPENDIERQQISKSIEGCPTKSIHDTHEPAKGWRSSLGLDESTTPTSIGGGVMQIITGWFRKKK